MCPLQPETSQDPDLPKPEPHLRTLALLRSTPNDSASSSPRADQTTSDNAASPGSHLFDELRVNTDFSYERSVLLDAAAYASFTKANSNSTVAFLSPDLANFMGMFRSLADTFLSGVTSGDKDGVLHPCVRVFHLDSLALLKQDLPFDKHHRFLRGMQLTSTAEVASFISTAQDEFSKQKNFQFMRIELLAMEGRLNVIVVNPSFVPRLRSWASFERRLAGQLADLAEQEPMLLVVDMPMKPVLRYPEMGVRVATLVKNETQLLGY